LCTSRETDVAKRAVEPDHDAQRRHRATALGADDGSDAGWKVAIGDKGLPKIGVHWDQSAAAVLGGGIAQLDHRTDGAGRTDHHVPGQVGDLTGRNPALAASNTITQLRSECRVQLAKTRRSLTSPRERTFACLPAIVSREVDHLCIAK
jgi:hypothetical protein